MIDRTNAVPVNAAAAKELRPQTRLLNTRDCPTLLNVPVAEVMRRNPGKQFRDLTGVRLGESEVIGLCFFRGEGRSIWAVRCGCGLHEKAQHDWLARSQEKGYTWRCLTCKKLPREGSGTRQG